MASGKREATIFAYKVILDNNGKLLTEVTSLPVKDEQLKFIVVFTLFMIPISRLAIMIREFSKSDKYMNVVTELVVLIIILVLAARIVI